MTRRSFLSKENCGHRAGPVSRAVLEPPGVLALSYGVQTPAVAVAAHLVYGGVLGMLLGVR